MKSCVNLEIMDFVEAQILPRYASFDRAHSLFHITGVIKRATDLAQKLGADINMAYVAAAYHDLGLEGPRAIHHITSGKILMNDERLKRWFSPQQIKIMKEAVEDHRASASHSPRNIYGKIVAEADRDLSTDSVFGRAIEFLKDKYPTKNKEEHWTLFYEHMKNKYSVNGYIKLWIPESDNGKNLNNIRTIISQPIVLKEFFNKMY